jgi:hypothetical protein
MCNDGACLASSNVILNEAGQGFNLSCQIVCENNGFSGAVSQGSDISGTNGYVTFSNYGECYITNTYRVIDGIYDQGGIICDGYRANWTFCRCQ